MTGLDYAVAARPMPGQQSNGDRCLVEELGGEQVLLAVIDGLGHGPEAAAVADLAADALADGDGAASVEELMHRCHEALQGTRGAAVTIAMVDLAAQSLSWLGVGDVTLILLAAERDQPRLGTTWAGIVGLALPDLLPEQSSLQPGDLILLHSDGVVDDVDWRRLHGRTARTVADHMLEFCARDTDDAGVVAARLYEIGSDG